MEEGGSLGPAWAGAFPEPATCEAVSEHRFCSERGGVTSTALHGGDFALQGCWHEGLACV